MIVVGGVVGVIMGMGGVCGMDGKELLEPGVGRVGDARRRAVGQCRVVVGQPVVVHCGGPVVGETHRDEEKFRGKNDDDDDVDAVDAEDIPFLTQNSIICVLGPHKSTK